jgi:hypothetical protein
MRKLRPAYAYGRKQTKEFGLFVLVLVLDDAAVNIPHILMAGSHNLNAFPGIRPNRDISDPQADPGKPLMW